MTSWAEIAKHEEPEEPVASVQNPKTYPLGWIRLYRDEKNATVIEQHENDPYLQKEYVDFDYLMGKAICEMRIRWENHHYLAGTFYDYDIKDDLDDYESDDEMDSQSESDEEQNCHLVGGGYYAEDN
jgi:hypothetical protein